MSINVKIPHMRSVAVPHLPGLSGSGDSPRRTAWIEYIEGKKKYNLIARTEVKEKVVNCNQSTKSTKPTNRCAFQTNNNQKQRNVITI